MKKWDDLAIAMRKIFTDNIPDDLGASVATIGFFDGVHLGHQHLIRQVVDEAKERGLESMVITFDCHPRQVLCPDFHPLLLTSYEEKMVRLAKTGVDNCVVLHFTPEMAALSAADFMRQVLCGQLGVRRLVMGYDNRFGKGSAEGFDDYVRHGAALGLEVVQGEPLSVDGIRVSSSAIRRMLQQGDIETATKCLGHQYTLLGRVVEGYQQGRRLGFPTANLLLNDVTKMLPAPGVYVARVRLEGSMEMKRAVTNIGMRPTFQGHGMAIETHVINYNGDLYGKHMLVALTHYLREEKKFESTGRLVAQLREDVRRANAIFEEIINN